MTNIKFLKDRIIFDGHADTKQECETITLLCDNLAKSKDFNTVKYVNGYAEFEKVAKLSKLRFAPALSIVTVVFDSHVTAVTNSYGSVTTSGESLSTSDSEGSFSVTLEEGYVIDTVVFDNGDDADCNGSLSSTSKYSFYINPGYGGVNGTITITSKVNEKQKIDLTTLSGWGSLSVGTHNITAKAKGNHYTPSDASNSVSINKPNVPEIS